MPPDDLNAARMPGFPRAQFIREYTHAMDEGRAALFLGAGASIPVGFVDWRELLREIASELDIDIDRVTDLLSLAQYHVNHRGGRQKMNEAILDKFDQMAVGSALHDALVRLPVDEIWTTNYDRVIEDTYAAAGRSPDVKLNATAVNSHKSGRDVVIYKMHGDSRNPAEAVLTRDDYEKYHVSKNGIAFTTALSAALSNRVFLFIGFSFSDPNVGHVLARMRLLFGENRSEHFAIFKRPRWFEEIDDGEEQAEAKFIWHSTRLQIDDLKRFGVQVVLVDEYTEIAPLVESLVKSSRRNYVFVSGAAHEYGSFGEERLEEFSRALGARLAMSEKHLISGLGLGIGQDVVQGFFQAGFDGRASAVGDRATLRPFPQRTPGGEGDLTRFWHTYRSDMIRRAGFVIYIAGNKRDRKSGATVLSDGVRKEFDIATGFGAIPIPIGATGYVAAELWALVMNDPSKYYADPDKLRPFLDALGDVSKTNDELLDVVLRVMDIVSESY